MGRKSQNIRSVFNCLIFISAAILFSGCCSIRQMALENKKKPLQLETNPVGIFTLRTSNIYKRGFQPEVYTIEIKSEQKKEDKVYFVVSKPFSQVKDEYNEYLVSMDLVPGKYMIGEVSGYSGGFLIQGHFEFPVGVNFELMPNNIVYLGHIDMINRKRTGNEPRSGSVVPLVDQAVTGFSDSTFDITVSDRSGTDIPLFEQTYPGLKKYIVTPNLMHK